MSKLQYFNYPGWGDHANEHYHYSQVVRVGNEYRISGQGRNASNAMRMKHTQH